MVEAIVRCAQSEDANRLISFLQEAKLGTEGVKESIEYFLLLENQEGRIQATLGIEPLGKVGLLRSLVMTQGTNEKDLMMIFEQMLKLAHEKKIESLYLATNKETSLSFFAMLGFKKEGKETLPQELFRSEHVKHITTVDNSFFMVLSL